MGNVPKSRFYDTITPSSSLSSPSLLFDYMKLDIVGNVFEEKGFNANKVIVSLFGNPFSI